jgi:hypothetical protein
MSRASRARIFVAVLGVTSLALAGGPALAYFTTVGAGTPAASVSSLGKPTLSTATGVVGGRAKAP